MLKTRSCSLAWLTQRADWVGLGCPPATFHCSHCTPLLLNMQMCKSANQTIHYVMLHSFGRHSHPGQLEMLVGAERIVMKGIWIEKHCLSVDLFTRDMTQNYEQLILTSLWESLTRLPRKVFYYLGERQKSSSSLNFFSCYFQDLTDFYCTDKISLNMLLLCSREDSQTVLEQKTIFLSELSIHC